MLNVFCDMGVWFMTASEWLVNSAPLPDWAGWSLFTNKGISQQREPGTSKPLFPAVFKAFHHHPFLLSLLLDP